MLGVNFATQTDKLELGGSARYNYQDGDIASIGSTEDFLPDGNSYSNSNSKQRNKAKNFQCRFPYGVEAGFDDEYYFPPQLLVW